MLNKIYLENFVLTEFMKQHELLIIYWSQFMCSCVSDTTLHSAQDTPQTHWCQLQLIEIHSSAHVLFPGVLYFLFFISKNSYPDIPLVFLFVCFLFFFSSAMSHNNRFYWVAFWASQLMTHLMKSEPKILSSDPSGISTVPPVEHGRHTMTF